MPSEVGVLPKKKSKADPSIRVVWKITVTPGHMVVASGLSA